jgi:fermentation-respiration switch protein FrsA (DUF1100 family)
MLRRIALAGLAALLTACGAADTPAPTATPVVAITLYPTATTAAMATVEPTSTPIPAPTATTTPVPLHPLTIEAMRQREYPGSNIVIEETLAPGSNYNRYYVSYLSEGLKIYALLTVPRGEKPDTGWPVIVFNHGYIPPDVYKTTERYIAYVDAFARNGYIVLRSDYRGHDRSEGEPTGAYGSPGYVVDVLNAVASAKRYPGADPNRIGMWGHSLGGYITLRSMVIANDIKAGVIWAGVVGSYADLLNRWRRRTPQPPPGNIPQGARRWRQSLQDEYGPPEQNPQFWESISANSYLQDLSGPVQLHHGTADTSVPLEFSELLKQQIEEEGGAVELFAYPGDNHNISINLGAALTRSVQFFDRYVKGA